MPVMKRKSICGFGYNDSLEAVTVNKNVNGKSVRVSECHIYSKWRNMIKRCYDPKTQEKFTSYIGCNVDPLWSKFSSFKRWFMWYVSEHNLNPMDLKSLCLDKDIIKSGNKTYSPKTCCLVDHKTNNFMLNGGSKSKSCNMGAMFRKDTMKYSAKVRDPETNKVISLGCYKTKGEALKVSRVKKFEIGIACSRLQGDERVSRGIIRFSKSVLRG